MRDLFSLAGKTALVTGGSTGIGAMIAEGFVNFGAKVYIVARREDVLKKRAGGTCTNRLLRVSRSRCKFSLRNQGAGKGLR